MRNIAALLTLSLILCLSSCKKVNPEEVSIKEVEFSLGGIIKSNKSAANLDDGDPVPSSILVTILDSDGDEVYNREPIDILRFGDAFVSEKINLLEGNFSLSEFFVLDADGKIVYAAPKEGSAFAQLVNDPLNIDFNTVDKEITEVQVEVLKAEYATPDKFGYGSFELNIVGTMDIQVAISAYDYDTEQLQLTTAELTVTDNEGNDVSISLGDSTNVVRLRDSLSNYYLSISKETYDSFLDTLSFAEISAFEVGKSALKVTLLKDSDGDGVPDNIDQCDDTAEGEEVDDNGCPLNPVFLSENGITIKAKEWAEVGDQGVIDGITYTVVDEAMLRQMVVDGEDVTKIATTKVTDMARLFAGDLNSEKRPFNEEIGNWDVSNVTNMSQMFDESSFNQDIGIWDVTKVTSMVAMFEETPFNQDLSSWNVSSVRDMSGMFQNSKFNKDISTWNVASVEYMTWMFRNSKFNQDISNWNVSRVSNMRKMFMNSPFNQDISSWNVSNVTDMIGMFGETPFSGELGRWDVGNVTDMSEMFYGNNAFNSDISSWNVSNVRSMNVMFANSQFNSDISNWDVSNVEDMSFMFISSGFNRDLSSWNVFKVVRMTAMFADGSSFNQDISSWNVSNVQYMGTMFANNKIFNQDLSSWNVSKVIEMDAIFFNSVFNQDISNWDVSSVKSMDNMFQASQFNQDISGWNVSNVERMPSMFSNNLSFNRDLSSWDVDQVTLCSGFSSGTNNWNLPKPNFTNCN
jgi:surface protein